MGVIIIDLFGDDEDVVAGNDDPKSASKPIYNDRIRYLPQLEIVPVERDTQRNIHEQLGIVVPDPDDRLCETPVEVESTSRS